jgi:hypothetical protein
MTYKGKKNFFNHFLSSFCQNADMTFQPRTQGLSSWEETVVT